MTGLGVVWILVGIVIVVAIIITTFEMNKIANNKGYEGYKYFWLCFCAGIFGYLVVIALPDKKLQASVDKANGQNTNYTATTEQLPML